MEPDKIYTDALNVAATNNREAMVKDKTQVITMHGNTVTARDNLDLILSSATALPLKYWRPGFWFRGAGDENLFLLTGGGFPHAVEKGKTHPVYALKALPGHAGFRVCPCSSKRPYQSPIVRFIRKGCVLKHKKHEMDRHSYLIEGVSFNIPVSEAGRLRFMGEVPEACIVRKGKG